MESAPRILYEDDDILVVNKPAGMIVNRADTSRHVLTLQAWVEEKLHLKKEISGRGEESEFENRGGIVHRLDKETSGLLVLAKNEVAFINMQSQFKSRDVKKTYVALCHGTIVPADGEINVPIGRLPWNRTKFGVLSEGRASKTLYKVISYKKIDYGKNVEDLTLIEAYPQTGRTHQIRVHLRYLGHPIFSDELYAGRKIMKRDRKLLPRHFLHAIKLSFTHPVTGQSMEFESPLPPELSDFLSRLAS